MRFSSLCLPAILLLSLPSARVFAADKWVHATSAHFDMYTDESEAAARAALGHLETVRAFFANATKATPRQRHLQLLVRPDAKSAKDPDGQPVRIVSFHSDGDFYRYKPQEYSLVSAYSLPGSPDTIVSKGLKPETYEYIFLEYCQAALDQSVPKFPFWIRAGLAQFYSTLKPGDGTIRLGASPTRSSASSVSNINMTALITVDRIGYLESRGRADASVETDTSFGKKAPAAESLSDFENFQVDTWMLTHMVILGRDYRAQAAQFVNALANGQETAAAFQSIYGESLNQVLGDMRVYGKQSGLAVVDAKFAPDKPAPPQIQTMTKEEQANLIAELSKRKK